MGTYTDRRNASELPLRKGEKRRLEHLVEASSSDETVDPTSFTVSGVTCDLYNGAAAVVSGAAGDKSSGTAKRHTIWYLWDTAGAAAGRYSYVLKATLSTGETYYATGSTVLLSLPSEYDRWVERVKGHLADAGCSDAGAVLAFSRVMECLDQAVVEYSRVVPRVRQTTVDLTQSVWEYALPTDWVADFSRLTQVEYPVDADSQIRYLLDLATDVEWDDHRGMWRFRYEIPAVSEQARLNYTGYHELDDAGTSVPDQAFSTVAEYAAGLALLRLANEAVRTEDPTIGADLVNRASRQAQYLKQAQVLMAQARAAWRRPAAWNAGEIAL